MTNQMENIGLSSHNAGAKPPPPDSPVPTRPERCVVERWLSLLGHRWNALILWHLQSSPLRHHELQAKLPGITAKVLAERMKSLVANGLVERTQLPTFPRTVAYSLSARGLSLLPVLNQLGAWAEVEEPSRVQHLLWGKS